MRRGNYYRVALVALLFFALALAVSTCGGRKQPVVQGFSPGSADTAKTSPEGLDYQAAISELDALPCPDGVDSALWTELKAALEAALTEDGGAGDSPANLQNHGRVARATRIVSAPPTGDHNRVTDLAVSDDGGRPRLTWHYRNLGDYDQNGRVGIEDITPIAVHFGQEYDPETEPNSLLAVIDGNGNGKVGIEDITPIAVHFGIEVADYLLEGATALEGPFGEVEAVPVEEASGGDNGRAAFEHTFTPGEYSYFSVTARDAGGTAGEASNTVGLALQILSVSPTEVKEGTVVTFSSEVLGAGPLSYEWDFGGGAQYETYTEPSPRVVLTREIGAFPATLTVTNPMGDATFPFILSKLAREWKYEVVLSTDKENEEVGTGELCVHEDKLFLYAYINDLEAIATVARYLVSGTSGSWEYESMEWSARNLILRSDGSIGAWRYSGPFLNWSLNLSERTNGQWINEVIETGLTLTGCGLAYAADDVPFAAYIYRYWEPETTVELRYARRVDGEWLYGVIDDAGGPGGQVLAPILLRIDPEGNPAVAYRDRVSGYELRLARWSPPTERWEIQVVRDSSGADFNFAFDLLGQPCFVYGGNGSTGETEAIHYLCQNDDGWEDEIVEEWPEEEVYLHSFNLAYDPLGHPLTTSYCYTGEPRIRVWWHSGSAWETAAEFANTYVIDGSTGHSLNLLVAADGTPYLTYCRSDNWDDGPKEVTLVRYD